MRHAVNSGCEPPDRTACATASAHRAEWVRGRVSVGEPAPAPDALHGRHPLLHPGRVRDPLVSRLRSVRVPHPRRSRRRRVRHREREEVGLPAGGRDRGVPGAAARSSRTRPRQPSRDHRARVRRAARRVAHTPDEPQLPAHLVQVTAAELAAECTAALAPLETAANRAWWDANTDAGEETQRRRAAADLALSDALADDDAYAAVRRARDEAHLEPLVARELEVLQQAYAPHQVAADLRRQIVDLQSDIESRFARHRGTIDGEAVDDNQILDILRTSDDSARRRAAWQASKTVGGEVAADVRELARLRNRAAQSLGYRDHFALALETTDFDEGRLFETLDAVAAMTDAPFRALKAELDERLATRFGVAADDLRPWHSEDPFFQDAPSAVGVDLDPYLLDLDLEALTAQTFSGMGLDVRGVIGRSDLVPRDGKSQHAFCIDVDREGDVRVLSNNTPGERWSETMLHEFGHAAYFEGVGRELPWVLRTMHICLTEAVAMRCGRLVRDPEWLRRVAGVPAATVSDLAPRLHAASRAYLLIFARWVLVMTHFERGLYARPDDDHDTRWWDLVERFQLVRRPDQRHEPDWAAKVHIAAAPVYYHNYLYGEMIASQLTAAFGALVDDPDAGPALTSRLFAPAATKRWDALVEDATGALLTPAAFASELAD